jgi:hypothetical protein
MSDQIGDGVAEDRAQSEKDLQNALKGETSNNDYFELNSIENEDDSIIGSSTTEAPITELPATEPVVENVSSNSQETLETTSQEAAPKSTPESDMYKETLKLMYGGSIKTIVEIDAEGNEVEVSIEDAVIDKEYFSQLVEAKQSEIKEEAAKDKVSVKGVSDFTRRMIEIDRKGGNINDLLKAKEVYSDPLDQIDLDTESGQETAVYLRMMAAGQDQDSTRRLIASYKAEGILEEKARVADSELRAGLEHQMKLAEKEAEIEAENIKNLMKSYKKDIRENLTRFELNDNIKNKIVKLATAKDDNGRFEIDNHYRAFREDPQLAADLALFLLDKEEYDKQVTNQAVQNTKLSTAKTLKVVKTDAGAGVPLKENTNSNRGDGRISISSLND